MSAIVGTVGADKGGNAKTFTVLNTAGTFASYENNPKVLAIDCDPSGDLSSNFFGANAGAVLLLSPPRFGGNRDGVSKKQEEYKLLGI